MAPALFPPSLSTKSAFYLLIEWTLEIGGLFPSPPPHPTSAPEGGGGGGGVRGGGRKVGTLRADCALAPTSNSLICL